MTLALLLCALAVYAQTVEPSSAVQKRMLQLEFESLYLIEKQEAEQVNSWSIPSVLARYGLNNSVEVQVNVPLLREAVYEDQRMVNSRTFLDKVQTGVSVNLWKESGMLPEAAVMARALIPVYAYDNSEVGLLLALNMSNRLSEDLSLNYNLGLVSEESEESGYYIFNLSWNISSKVHSFVEFFGSTFNGTEITHNLNTGIGFNLGNSFCLDLSVAQGLNQNMLFYGGIFTYQLNI